MLENLAIFKYYQMQTFMRLEPKFHDLPRQDRLSSKRN